MEQEDTLAADAAEALTDRHGCLHLSATDRLPHLRSANAGRSSSDRALPPPPNPASPTPLPSSSDAA
jgi:hypothetical protein